MRVQVEPSNSNDNSNDNNNDNNMSDNNDRRQTQMMMAGVARLDGWLTGSFVVAAEHHVRSELLHQRERAA